MCYHWQRPPFAGGRGSDPAQRSGVSLRSGRRRGSGGSVVSCEVIAFEDLGCEAVKRLEIRDFPLIVGVDCHGGNLFAEAKNR